MLTMMLNVLLSRNNAKESKIKSKELIKGFRKWDPWGWQKYWSH